MREQITPNLDFRDHLTPNLDLRYEGIQGHNEIWHKMTQNEFLFITCISKPDNVEDRHVWTIKCGLKSLAFCS